MQAPKNAFYYVLDRRTGELISAEKYAPANWAERVDPATGRPVVNQEVADWTKGPRLLVPGPWARTTGSPCRSARTPAWPTFRCRKRRP